MRSIYKIVSKRDFTILNLLKERDYTRSELVEITGIPRTTIHDIIERLRRAGVKINKYGVITGRRGRPKVFYKLVEVPDDIFIEDGD